MTTDTALIEKREELKRRLAAGEYKTLVDIFLEWFDRLIRKITRHAKPLPIWLIIMILSLIVVLINFIAIYVGGDLVAIRRLFDMFGMVGILTIISTGILVIISAVVMNQYIGRILALWRDEILNATESIASLVGFEDWLEKTYNWRLQLLVIIIGSLFFTLYLAELMSIRIGIFVGYGATFTCIIPSIFGIAFLYLFLRVIALSSRLHRYDLKLFAADPSSSELISRLSNELSFVVYFVAVYAVITTLSSASTGSLPSVGIVLVLILWVPIIAMFILNQTSLSGIIRRAKRKTLNEIQARVEKLQMKENFEEKETMEAINRLMDYHDRVKATRNSALDLGAVLGFINSLLLPLLAFLLGNLDVVLKLLGIKP